jgi:putative ABC transport system permease protein
MIGVYGLLSYLTLQRTREMGIRLAMGTTPARLRVRLLLESVAVVCVGTAVGAVLSTSLGRFLKLLIPGADGLMTINVGAAVVVTCAVAGIAVWIATSHIARLDIAEVLRAEAAD